MTYATLADDDLIAAHEYHRDQIRSLLAEHGSGIRPSFVSGEIGFSQMRLKQIEEEMERRGIKWTIDSRT